jgi:hypothetical protein
VCVVKKESRRGGGFYTPSHQYYPEFEVQTRRQNIGRYLALFDLNLPPNSFMVYPYNDFRARTQTQTLFMRSWFLYYLEAQTLSIHSSFLKAEYAEDMQLCFERQERTRRGSHVMT